MKRTKKMAVLLLALIMVCAMGTGVFAQDVGTAADGKATITVTNAAKGETYKIYKLFDASVTGTEGGSIAYTGTIPDSLTTYFEKDSAGNITATAAAGTEDAMSDGLKAALKTWAAGAVEKASAESDGTSLNFKGLDYGYYVVTTTQGEQAITVTSTNPNAEIVDKNSSEPSNLTKTVDDDDVNIGDTVTYTVTFKTSNYTGAGTEAKKIVSYTIEDTLPDFLSLDNDNAVQSIIVDNDGDSATEGDQNNVTAQFTDKKIVLDWYNEDSQAFLYGNGATVTVVYKATVTDKAAIDGLGNTNTVTLKWTVEGKTDPEQDTLTDNETIYTYAIALKKVNEEGAALAGAVFTLPFYVKETPDNGDGAYIYAGTAAGTGLTNQVTTPGDGAIVIKGVQSGTYSITEATAPNGYNKLTDAVSVRAVKTGETTTNKTFYLDENGNVVDTETDTTTAVTYANNQIAATAVLIVNKTGSLLPSTGGRGTTMFYVAGSILVIGAVVLFITKKRMGAKK